MTGFRKILKIGIILGFLFPVISIASPEKKAELSLAHLKFPTLRTLLEQKEKQKNRIPKVAFKKLQTKKTPYFNQRELSSIYTSWGINPLLSRGSINLLNAWKGFKKKNEVVVAVIDTGIDFLHPFIKDNLYSFTGKVNSRNFGKDFSIAGKIKSSPHDVHGHGTHVAGIVKSVFPEVKILPLKYFRNNASGQENLKATIRALKYAVDRNVDIINYSGGGPQPSIEELKILKEAEAKGILIVAAAGNEESNLDLTSNSYYPANYGLSNIITVMAHDRNSNVLSSSNFGKSSVDISAPGNNIRSAIPTKKAGYLTGTSQATAFVTGVASLLKSQYPELNASQIKKAILWAAKKENNLASKCKSGGRLDAEESLKKAKTLYDQETLLRNLANR